jgi:hypothetical protein
VNRREHGFALAAIVTATVTLIVLAAYAPNERVLAEVGIRVVILFLAIDNARLAFGSYREHGDARGLRGFVAGMTMLGGALAFASASQGIRDMLGPQFDPTFRAIGGAGVLVFVAGLIFSRLSWVRRDRA